MLTYKAVVIKIAGHGSFCPDAPHLTECRDIALTENIDRKWTSPWRTLGHSRSEQSYFDVYEDNPTYYDDVVEYINAELHKSSRVFNSFTDIEFRDEKNNTVQSILVQSLKICSIERTDRWYDNEGSFAHIFGIIACASDITARILPVLQPREATEYLQNVYSRDPLLHLVIKGMLDGYIKKIPTHHVEAPCKIDDSDLLFLATTFTAATTYILNRIAEEAVLGPNYDAGIYALLLHIGVLIVAAYGVAATAVALVSAFCSKGSEVYQRGSISLLKLWGSEIGLIIFMLWVLSGPQID